MKRIPSHVMKLISLSVLLIMIISNTTYAAGGNVVNSNAATSYDGDKLDAILYGDSKIDGNGRYAKITLYIATANITSEGIALDKNKYMDMTNTLATRKDGAPMFVKFGKSIITNSANEGILLNSYTNLATCRYDELINFKAGSNHYPVYDNSTLLSNKDLVTSLNVPRWTVYPNDKETNNFAEVKKYFTGNGNNEIASETLRKIIVKVAEKSHGAGNKGTEAVNNVLYSIKQNVKFKYKDKNGKDIDLQARHVLPTMPDYVANWLIVYEPVTNYIEDPQNVFYPKIPTHSFLMTVSDAVLANAHAGTSGYPCTVKFIQGTPAVTLTRNYCKKCGKSWYGYPKWPHSDFPIASRCPNNCSPSNYTGEKEEVRYPFGIGKTFRVASKRYTIEKNWLKYKDGYLFDKPPKNIEDLVAHNSDWENMLHYGGFLLFHNGPQMDDKGTPQVYVKAVVANIETGNFTSAPNVPIHLTVTKKNSDGTNKVYTTTVKTGSDYVLADFTPSGNEDLSKTFINATMFPDNVGATDVSKLGTTYYIEDLIKALMENSDSIQTDDLLDFLKMIVSGVVDSDYDETLILEDGTKIGKNYMTKIDWGMFFATSTKKAIKNLGEVKDDETITVCGGTMLEGKLPVNFTYDGNTAYITVILPLTSNTKKLNFESTNIINEDELMKAITNSTDSLMSRVTVKKTSTDTTCPGYVTVSYEYTEKVTLADGTTKEVTKTGYRDVNCGHAHTLANAKRVTPDSITVQPSWYWSEEMFNNVSKLSVLRNSGKLVDDGVTFVFNTTSAFTANDMNNAFDTLTGYRFVIHRNADSKNDGSVKPLQLAAYMNGTSENTAYLNFMSKYYGTYPSAYSNQTGSFGNNKFTLLTHIKLPQSATAIGSGDFCSGGSSNSLNVPVKLTGELSNSGKVLYSDEQFWTYTPITIKETYKSLDKAASSFATTKQYYGIAPNDNINPMYLIQVQSDAISFNPAFKMKYQDSNDPFSAFKNVWVLAAGKKTFISNDYVKIELKNSDVSVTAPWSRDSEDKVDKNGNVRTIPTAKSGNTIKTSADGATLQVDVYYHIQDPNFVDPSQRTTLQAKNDAKAKQFDDMVNSIASAFENNGVSFYSNLFQSTTAETVHKVSAPSYFKDYSEKSILKFAQPITTSVKSQTKAYYIDVNGVADYTTSARKININGNSVPVTEKWADISAVRSEEVMKGLLEQNAGYTKKWYSEDYEGIIVVHKTYLIAINNLESTYAQIHPQTSDSLTKRNELAQDLKFAQGSETLIEDHFGIGVEYRLPSLTINNETFSNIVIPSKPYLFDIRGAVYDTK